MDYEITECHDHSHEYSGKELSRVFEEISYDVKINGVAGDEIDKLVDQLERLREEDCKLRGDDSFIIGISNYIEYNFWFKPEDIHAPTFDFYDIKLTCIDENMIGKIREILKNLFVKHLSDYWDELKENEEQIKKHNEKISLTF